MRAGTALALGAALGSQLPTRARETDSLRLAAGWNAAAWCGADRPVLEATAPLPLRIAHTWDLASRSWRTYAPGAPIDTIGMLRHGQPLWMQLTSDADWPQPPYRGAQPAETELPVGWSLLGWTGLHQPVWTVFGEDPWGPVAEARRWNPELQEWLVYTPGESAQQLFAVLHPGDAVWVRMRVSGARWNPARGVAPGDRALRLVPGTITYYHSSLAGGQMYCTGKAYDPQDVTVAAAVTWPCGTRLRIWRDERYVDVVVQDTGLLGLNHVDLSEAAFQRLALLPEGRAQVFIEVLAGPQ